VKTGMIQPQMTQMDADSESAKIICENLRTLRLNQPSAGGSSIWAASRDSSSSGRALNA
jgi:hypothetical protein